MAQQHVVRVIVPADDASALRAELLESKRLDVREIEVGQPDPGLYRDERSDRSLHRMVVRGGWRLVVGGVAGAVVGVLIVLSIPFLRDLMPWTLLLFAGGGAYAGSVAYTATGVEVDESQDDMEDRLYEVDADGSRRTRILTIIVGRDRNPVEDLLESRGYVLLDSEDPKLDGEAER